MPRRVHCIADRAKALIIICCAGVVVVTVAQGRTVTGPSVQVKEGSLTFDGTPTFPILGSSGRCPPSIDNLRSAGVTVVVHSPYQGACDDVTSLHALLSPAGAASMWWYEQNPVDEQNLQGLPELLDWQAATKVVWDPSSLIGCASRGSVGQLALAKEAAGPTRVAIGTVQVGSPLSTSTRICITPQRVVNSSYVWVIGGARALSWSTINPVNASTGDFSVLPENAQAAGTVSGQLAFLQPVILTGTPVAIAFKHQGTTAARAWKYRGVVYVVVANTSSNTTTSCTLLLKGVVKVTRTALWGMGRSRRIASGTLVDNFPPLAVHIYKLTPRRA
jgi:hypothetical protein